MIKDPFQEQNPHWSYDSKAAIYPSPVVLIVEDGQVEMATEIVDHLVTQGGIEIKGSGVMIVPRSLAAGAALVANYRLGYQIHRGVQPLKEER